ncbi:hypothetical protein I549_6098 [Mycobacterium avium subsp. avium 2285 (R)]|nr:hypothetical protein I549_6098 [Mycobacterium avium subsp. avium 2285 (R)]
MSTTAATRCAPALPELAIAAEHDGGDPLRPALPELAIAAEHDGGDPLRSGSAGAGDRR